MRLNDDFTARVLVRFDETDWTASPSAGVERRMLDRIGGEVARATTIVRFAPGSAFAPHVHDGGEEFLVLDGVFQDESGDFPAGAYVRNPPTSRHTPAAAQGCTILVKLHQFHPDDRTEVRLDTAGLAGSRRLHGDEHEEVWLHVLAPGETLEPDASGGAELFVIEGGAEEGGDSLSRWDWLRLPPGARPRLVAGPEGARLWVKTGHLASMPAPLPA